MISLHVKDLSKQFGNNPVLKKVSFHHTEGVLGIEGPNGSGKSTLLKCISGLLRPGSGTISWKDGETEISLEAMKKRMGFAAPYISLYGELTVSENLAFLSKLRKAKLKHTVTEQLLTELELQQAAEKAYGSLSTGQQQRARLAAALFHDPEVLLLDEPGSNLDEQGRAVIKDIVDKARREKKLVILASNSPQELNLCDQTFSVQNEHTVTS